MSPSVHTHTRKHTSNCCSIRYIQSYVYVDKEEVALSSLATQDDKNNKR